MRREFHHMTMQKLSPASLRAKHCLLLNLILLLAPALHAQAAAQQSAPPSSAREVAVAKLPAVIELRLPDWKWHADVSTILHPEAVAFDDSQWPAFTVGQ